MPDDYPKKLIEVSIPLQEINAACAYEKLPGIGPHPRGLHLWWARRPLAAARAVLFCQLVDDPSGYVDELLADKLKRQRAQFDVDMELEMTPQASPKLEEKLIERERERLLGIVKELVVWKNTTNEKVLNKARKEIRNSWKRTCRREGKPEDTPMPPVLDPFAGGGAIPLEAQRLGMEAHASDLNPVAVLINKAMIEIPPKFAGRPPVNPDWQAKTKEEKAATTWTGAQGLAEDVRYYGEWMRQEAEKTDRAFVSEIRNHAGDSGGTRRFGESRISGGRRIDRHRLALGADRAESEPGSGWKTRAAGFVLLAVEKEGKRGLRGADCGGWGIPI